MILQVRPRSSFVCSSHYLLAIVVMLWFWAFDNAMADLESEKPYGAATYAAPYISEQAQAVIRAYVPQQLSYPTLDDVAGWSQLQQGIKQHGAAILQAYVESGGEHERSRADFSEVEAYWFSTSKTSSDGPVLVFTHGGAYVGGSGKEVFPSVLAIANAAGMRVLSIDYRLAPQNPFPAAVNDAVAVYRWLLETGQDNSEIGWFGASAGGGLALAAMHALKQEGLPLPGAIAVLSPWTDLTLMSESYFTLDADDPVFTRDKLALLAATYYQQSDPKNPLVSPVYGNFSNFPPMLIQVGSKEILLSDSLRVARLARAAGVDVSLDVWDGLWHVFQSMGVPESSEAIDALGEFFRQHLVQLEAAKVSSEY